MGRISLVLMNVEGSDETVGMAIAKASELIGNMGTREPVTVPVAEIPAAAQAISNQTVRASVKAVHRAVTKRVKAAAQESAGDSLHCPIIGCLRSFSKRAWLNNHLRREHNTESV